jgi:hypothetical protein
VESSSIAPAIGQRGHENPKHHQHVELEYCMHTPCSCLLVASLSSTSTRPQRDKKLNMLPPAPGELEVRLLEGDLGCRRIPVAMPTEVEEPRIYGTRCCASSTSKSLVTEPRSWSCRYHRSWCVFRREFQKTSGLPLYRPADLSTNSTSRVGSIVVEALRQTALCRPPI